MPCVAVAADGSVPGVNLVHSAVEQELNVSLAASWAATLLSGATVADPFLSGVDKEVAVGLWVMVFMLPLPAVPSSHSRVPVSSWISPSSLCCPRLRLAAQMSVQVLQSFTRPSSFIVDLLTASALGFHRGAMGLMHSPMDWIAPKYNYRCH